MRDEPGVARIGSLANLLGIARILATPVVIALILIGSPGLGIVAFVLFALAAATDFLDGWVARARGEVSPLGVFMDLTADKVLVAVAWCVGLVAVFAPIAVRKYRASQ